MPPPTQPGLSDSGPHYRPGAPARAVLSAGIPGQPVRVEGRLVSAEGRPVPDVWVDVWHAAPDGRYDDVSAAFVGRGRVKSDGEGRVTFSTVMPGAYLAPYPGAAARPHIHLLAEAPGFRRLCVQWEIPSRPGERVEEQHPIAVCELRVGPSSTSPWVLTMTAFLDRG